MEVCRFSLLHLILRTFSSNPAKISDWRAPLQYPGRRGREAHSWLLFGASRDVRELLSPRKMAAVALLERMLFGSNTWLGRSSRTVLIVGQRPTGLLAQARLMLVRISLHHQVLKLGVCRSGKHISTRRRKQHWNKTSLIAGTRRSCQTTSLGPTARQVGPVRLEREIVGG